ncbi:FIGNL1-interacting regulator of recombination and mitosis-like [Hetaerina americana]|uniref:FIGNL1-interacting regulator of recombination and mitosis-like n=1 Tax=Hetaerina americana TaxID=62018 RepID=UPI003A7F459D
MASLSTDELLDIFETLHHQELREKTEELLPASLNAENESCKAMKVLRVVINSCLPMIRIQNAEEEIFKHALPAVKHLFRETINGIHFKLLSNEPIQSEEVADDIDGLLKVCHILLEYIEGTLQYVISNTQVNASEIPSLSKNVAEVMLESFKHCKESSGIYGNFFQPLSENLSLLFKKSHAIQGLMISALTSNIKYNISYEEDLTNFIDVLEVMEEIAEVVSGLDIKTMANQWKFYAKILQENVDNLKQRIDISRPIKFLSSEIESGLKAILESDISDSKSVARSLKLLNFSLKILILFCEMYVGYLGMCHKELLHLVVYLLSNSHPYLQILQIQGNIINDVESYLIIGVEPLVLRLMEENELAQEYIQFAECIDEKENMRLGFLLLSVMLMKNIIHCDDGIRKIWLQNDPSSNIIALVFRTLGHCHLELSQDFQIKGSCKGPTAGGSGATHGVYESLTIHMSALISTLPAESIPALELILIENILSRNGNIWQALLATDIWCLIARCGTAELCFKHVCQLARLGMKMLQDRSCPEASYLRMALCRLFSLLSNKGMVQMCEKFPPVSYPRLWHVFGLKKLPEQLRMKLQGELIAKSIQEIEKFTSNPIDIHSYGSMMDAIVGAAAAFDCTQMEKNEGLTNHFTFKIMEVWASIREIKFSSESMTSQRWLDKFFKDLTIATICVASSLSNTNILQVLHVLLHEKFQSFYSVKLASIKFLRSLAVIFFDIDKNQTIVWRQIAKTFSLLLKDNNAIIRQYSLETFTYFSQVTKHEQIVPMSVGGSQDVKAVVAHYLNKIPCDIPLGKQITLSEYLKKQLNVKPLHFCGYLGVKTSTMQYKTTLKSPGYTEPKNGQNEGSTNGGDVLFKVCDDAGSCTANETEVDFKSKKRKISDDVSLVIKRMKEDVNHLVKESNNEILPSEIQTELQEMINQLQSLVS